MESSDPGDKLTNYYHKMGDLHAKAKNYKSAFVYYTEAAEKYLEANKIATKEDLKEELRVKLENTIKKGEICKKRYNENRQNEHKMYNLSTSTKKFKDLTLKEQKYIFGTEIS